MLNPHPYRLQSILSTSRPIYTESSTPQLAHLALRVSLFIALFYIANLLQPYHRTLNSRHLQQREVITRDPGDQTCQLLVSSSWKGLGRVIGYSSDSLATPSRPLSHLYAIPASVVLEEDTDWKVS